MLVRKSSAALAAGYVVGLALAVGGPAFIPSYYYFDAATIRDLIGTADALVPGDSYNNTALVYATLGFGTLIPDSLAAPFSFTVAYASVVLAARLWRTRWHPWLFALFAAWTVPLAIYDGTYSKETVTLVVVAAMTALAGSVRGVAAAASLALAYALLFRTYWGVVLALWLTMLVTWRAGAGWPVRLLAAALVIVPLSLAAHEFVDLWLTDGRTVVVEARELVTDTATIFSNPLPNTSVGTDLVNAVAGWLTLLLPAYLLGLGGVQHVAFALFQLANTALFVAALHERRTPSGRPFDWRFASAATFCVAYSVVQGMFEPDFGSFAKHETTLLPMALYVLAQYAGRREARGSTHAALRARASG